MIPLAVTKTKHTRLLFGIAERHGLRVRLHRQDAKATDDAVFILEIVDAEGRTVSEVTTKNIESGAAYLIDKGRRGGKA